MYRLIIFVFFFFLLNACQNNLKQGNQAPDFKILGLDEVQYQLSKYKGKVVLVHFWTDWCQSCRAEFPKIQAFYEDLKSDDFELLAINVGQPESSSQDFKESFDVTFPMLTDVNGITQDLYKIKAFPTNYFVDTEGKIIRKIVGWVDKKQVEVIVNQHKQKLSKN